MIYSDSLRTYTFIYYKNISLQEICLEFVTQFFNVNVMVHFISGN
jgi:hypothetical protein